MKFLIIDTSTKYLAVVLSQKDKVLGAYVRQKDRAHGRLLALVIARLLEREKFSLADIAAVGVCVGPGSFTGLRIGLATAKGIGLALNKPLVGFSSLDALAYNQKIKKGTTQVWSVMDAKRGQVYAAGYAVCADKVRQNGKYFLGDVPKLLAKIKTDVIFTGDGVEVFREPLSGAQGGKVNFSAPRDWPPRAQALARLVWDNYQNNKAIDPAQAEALYLYPDFCTVRKKEAVKTK